MNEDRILEIRANSLQVSTGEISLIGSTEIQPTIIVDLIFHITIIIILFAVAQVVPVLIGLVTTIFTFLTIIALRISMVRVAGRREPVAERKWWSEL